ncbi:MAG: 16S rRNA (guanine(966)-N(2))-methyltransferase RsmD [Tissierella sp.]|nr:16S rRNA (guanine(966)-N(2))-methyltransferase RsmD [Tissierella sp.]
MRVISGLRKGHRLNTPKGSDTRPTEDKIKESLFNILGHIQIDSVVLDLFGGSGSIGIEFLSRGAKECYFVDSSTKSISTIKENLIHTKLMESATVIKSDAIKAIKHLNNKKLEFDYIYLDPPYRHSDLLFGVLSTLKEYPIFSDNVLLIIEHESELILEDNIFDFNKVDERRYGSKRITFLGRD